jgi:membrane protein
MILGIGFLLMASLVASAAFAALSKWRGPVLGHWAAAASIIELGLSALVNTVVFAMIYKLIPRARRLERCLGRGGSDRAGIHGRHVPDWHLHGRSGIASGFGAAAPLVVVLVWVYYSAQTFLLGAEFTWACAHKFDSRRA